MLTIMEEKKIVEKSQQYNFFPPNVKKIKTPPHNYKKQKIETKKSCAALPNKKQKGKTKLRKKRSYYYTKTMTTLRQQKVLRKIKPAN